MFIRQWHFFTIIPLKSTGCYEIVFIHVRFPSRDMESYGKSRVQWLYSYSSASYFGAMHSANFSVQIYFLTPVTFDFQLLISMSYIFRCLLTILWLLSSTLLTNFSFIRNWLSKWSVGTILMGLYSFMLEETPTHGSMQSSSAFKRKAASESLAFNCQNK